MEEPCLCEVLSGAVLDDDGTVRVAGVDGLTESTARLECLYAALRELQRHHKLYQERPAVQSVLATMSSILEHRTQRTVEEEAATAAAAAARAEDAAVEATDEDGPEITYLVPTDPKIPRADEGALRRVRTSAVLEDDLDVRFFPHLFPNGTGGWQNSYRSFAQYARKRLLGKDPRFEASPAYIMWLLETQMKKRLSSNVNVRVGLQHTPGPAKGYEDGSRRVYTALRDLPGTQPYLCAKKGVALNMYEQRGRPNFFLTLTCHAKQPGILAAAIAARLLRQLPDLPPSEPLILLYAACFVARGVSVKALTCFTFTRSDHIVRLEQRVAELLQRFQDEDFQWDGLSANQLCNQQPAIVARQFQHQLRQFLRWLAPQIAADNGADILADPQDHPRDDEEEDAASVAAPATDQGGKHHSMPKERPPFQVTDYIVRIEWQKRGYPHAHILLWAKMPMAKTGKAPGKEEAEDVDWSDEEARHKFVPTRAEELSDKCICTKSPGRWLKSEKIDPDNREVNAKLARLVEHRCSAYCGRFTLGSCRFGFPHTAEARTRLRTAQEQFASRWKSSLATRRHEDDTMMGQYNIEMLRQWRASMDLQVICEVTSASRYILGYAFKSEEDFAAARRMEAIVEQLTALTAGSNLNHQQVYKAAHTALQGRTTSVFEACHLLLGFAVVEFSRDNVWVQVGPPHTWTLWVPQQDESRAFEQPEAFYQAKQGSAPGSRGARGEGRAGRRARRSWSPGRWSPSSTSAAASATSASAKSLPSRGGGDRPATSAPTSSRNPSTTPSCCCA